MKRLVVFFPLSFLLTWLIWLPQYGSVLGLVNLSKYPYQHLLGGLGPALAAVIMQSAECGLRSTLQQFFSFRKPSLALLAMAVPFLVLGLGIAIQYGTKHSWPQWQLLGRTAEFPALSPVSFFLVNLLCYGIGEETGWRGFALPVLLRKINPVPATLLLTIGWAIWHVPAFLYRPGYMAMDITGVIGWLLSLLAGSFILTWIYLKTKPGIWACALFHAAMDVAFTGEGTDAIVSATIGVIITLLGVVAFIILLRQKPDKNHVSPCNLS